MFSSHNCDVAMFTGAKYRSIVSIKDIGHVELDCVTLIDQVLRRCCKYQGRPVCLDEFGKRLELNDWFLTEKTEELLNQFNGRCTRLGTHRELRHGDLILTKPFIGRRLILLMATSTKFFYLFEDEHVGVETLASPFWATKVHSFWRLNDY